MSAIITVQYPKSVDGVTTTFDNDYYVATHMPLVEKVWKDHGLKSWYAVSNSPANEYVTLAILIFDSVEAFGKASQLPEAKPIFDDIPNFTNVKPIITEGIVIGKN